MCMARERHGNLAYVLFTVLFASFATGFFCNGPADARINETIYMYIHIYIYILKDSRPPPAARTGVVSPVKKE
jgi:hypothetical protein